MKTLIVAGDARPLGHMETVLRRRGHELLFSYAPHDGLERRSRDVAIAFVELRAGTDVARDLCRRITAPDDTGPLVALYGETPPADQLDVLYAAGGHVLLSDDPALTEVRIPIFEKAAERRRRFAVTLGELREANARAASIVEALSEGVVVQRADREVVTVNASARRILGLDERDARERRWRRADWSVTSEDGVPVDFDEFPASVALRTKKPVRGHTYRMRNPEGREVWLSVNAHPVLSDDGSEATSVVTSLTDITEARAREETVRRQLDSASEGVLVHRDGLVVWSNRRWAELSGWGQSEVGMKVLDLLPVDRREQIAARLQQAAQGTPPAPLEQTVRHVDGTVAIVRTSTVPTLFEGKPALLTWAQDITEQRRLERQLVATDRLAALGQLAAGVGHEINNPLAYMIGNAEVALGRLRDGAPAEDVVPMLEQVLEGAFRVRDIVRDLRLLSSRQSEERVPLDVTRILESCLRMTDAEVRPRARVVRAFSPVPPVLVNEARTAQVFVNLLINAAHACPEGTPEKHTVRVTTSHVAPFVELIIEDDGSGIAPSDLEHVFDPFFTTKTDGSGTGLGLSISHMLVTTQGGTIDVASTLGKGTRVTVRLPVADRPVDAASSSAPAAAGDREGRRVDPAPKTPRARRRLLIVDDERAITQVLRGLFGHHDVVTASSGREALALLAAGRSFDLVLCDLLMPDVGGIELTREIESRFPALLGRIVYMSGGSSTPRATAFLAEQALRGAVCVDKPFAIDELVALVERRLAGPKGESSEK